MAEWFYWFDLGPRVEGSWIVRDRSGHITGARNLQVFIRRATAMKRIRVPSPRKPHSSADTILTPRARAI